MKTVLKTARLSVLQKDITCISIVIIPTYVEFGESSILKNTTAAFAHFCDLGNRSFIASDRLSVVAFILHHI